MMAKMETKRRARFITDIASGLNDLKKNLLVFMQRECFRPY